MQDPAKFAVAVAPIAASGGEAAAEEEPKVEESEEESDCEFIANIFDD